MALEQIIEDFSLLEDWEDRYRYVIELGRTLAPMDDALKTDATKVRGCASQVWLRSHVTTKSNHQHGPMQFEGDSDAMIVRGLIAILFAIYDGKTPEEILAIDPNETFTELGLNSHLTPQRSNGLAAMIARIRADAEHAHATS